MYLISFYFLFHTHPASLSSGSSTESELTDERMEFHAALRVGMCPGLTQVLRARRLFQMCFVAN